MKVKELFDAVLEEHISDEQYGKKLHNMRIDAKIKSIDEHIKKIMSMQHLKRKEEQNEIITQLNDEKRRLQKLKESKELFEGIVDWDAKKKIYDRINETKKKLDSTDDEVGKKNLRKELKNLELRLKDYE